MSELKVDPDTLALRASPRPVTRLNRRTITVVVGALATAVLGGTLWSLRSSSTSNREAPTELHNVDRVAHADGLEQLPTDYSKLPPAATATVPPVLGPPLPGDLGGPILRAQQQAAMADSANLAAPLHPDAARVARIDRQREAEEALKAGLFFKESSRTAASTSVRGTTVPLMAPEHASSPKTPTQGDNDLRQDAQGEKSSFLSRATDAATSSIHTLRRLQSPYAVMAGTIIPAALITGINSDLPGPVLASVTEGVYDSATGRHLLIPQGARLIGQYDSQVAFGQRRVLLVWDRIVFPDASSITLDRLQGLDMAGNAGLEDAVDWHWRQLLAGAALSTLIGIGAELAAPDRANGQSQIVIATRESIQDSVNQTGQELGRRQLNVQPTLTVRPGFLVGVMVSKDLTLRPYQPLFFDRSAQ